MARPSTIVQHQRRAEIEDALARNEPLRSISARFGVTVSALHRHKQIRLGSSPAAVPTSLPTTLPTSLPTSRASLACEPAAKSPQPAPEPDPFDLGGQSFPWAPGEERRTDPMAEHLRQTQRQFGTAAVRTLVLDFVFRLSLAGLPDVAVARKLDVPPALVRRWREEQLRDQRAKLTFDAQDHLAHELAQLDQMEKPCWQRVLDTQRGSKAWTGAMTSLLRIKKQKQILLESAGLAEHMRLPPPPARDEHGAGLAKVAALRRSVDAILLAGFDAAGIGDETTIEDAFDQLKRIIEGDPATTDAQLVADDEGA